MPTPFRFATLIGSRPRDCLRPRPADGPAPGAVRADPRLVAAVTAGAPYPRAVWAEGSYWGRSLGLPHRPCRWDGDGP